MAREDILENEGLFTMETLRLKESQREVFWA